MSLRRGAMQVFQNGKARVGVTHQNLAKQSANKVFQRWIGPVALLGSAYKAQKKIRTASRETNREIESQHSPLRNMRHAEQINAIRRQGGRNGRYRYLGPQK